MVLTLNKFFELHKGNDLLRLFILNFDDSDCSEALMFLKSIFRFFGLLISHFIKVYKKFKKRIHIFVYQEDQKKMNAGNIQFQYKPKR